MKLILQFHVCEQRFSSLYHICMIESCKLQDSHVGIPTWSHLQLNKSWLLHYLSLGVPTLCECGSVGPLRSWWHSCVSRATMMTRSWPHSLQNRPPRRPPLWGEGRLHSKQQEHVLLRNTMQEGETALKLQMNQIKISLYVYWPDHQTAIRWWYNPLQT